MSLQPNTGRALLRSHWGLPSFHFFYREWLYLVKMKTIINQKDASTSGVRLHCIRCRCLFHQNYNIPFIMRTLISTMIIANITEIQSTFSKFSSVMNKFAANTGSIYRESNSFDQRTWVIFYNDKCTEQNSLVYLFYFWFNYY